jgi:(p)ppGpp synthase/HD superfamily hydrolase
LISTSGLRYKQVKMGQQKEWSIDDMQHIWQLASKLHDGQKYGGAGEGEQVEYINHIGSIVFEILNAIHYTENINADLALKCALLHDTLEDTPCSYEQINKLFGQQVANGVLALTKDDRIDGRLEKMRDSLSRIKQQPTEIWAVKLADRITNLYAAPYYWNDDKKRAYMEESELILAELGDGNKYLAERLRNKIQAYERFLGDT